MNNNEATSHQLTNLPAFAAEVLEYALDGGYQLADSTTLVVNEWGGFDIITRTQVIRLAQEDTTWTVRLFTRQMVLRGTQSFEGCFAAVAPIGDVVGRLL